MPEQTSSPIRRFHGARVPRGLGDVPHSPLYEGRFGRMFRSLAPLEPDDADLLALADTMVEENPEDPSNDNPDIPSDFTYLGQFIDHDLTFDPTSRLQRQNDPDALRNFRTPRFDLDSVYSSGPADSPYLYREDGLRFVIGKTRADEDDLPRHPAQGDEPRRALLGDPRNDENVIVSQVHLAFLKFHNRVVDSLRDDVPADQLFEEARQIVRWHYQWIVVHDFLRLLVGEDVVNDILKPDDYVIGAADSEAPASIPKVDLKFFSWRNQPYMPVEFSGAAYRFGHSQVRPSYTLNQVVRDVQLFSPSEEPGEFEDLRGFRERPPFWELEWNRFFEFSPAGELQPTRLINTRLAVGLARLPSNVNPGRRSLAELNLRRGKALGLPSGQDVARAMGIPESRILAGSDLGLPGDLATRLADATPLWYYILKEAEVHGAGKRLGPVGGRLVAEVFIGLLHGDQFSYLNLRPGWRPTPGRFGAREGDRSFGMPELLSFAGARIAPRTGRTLADLEADNPNIRQQWNDWRQARIALSEDPNDFSAFRQHLLAIGAPDPGEEFDEFRS
jgi:hypothetical protein